MSILMRLLTEDLPQLFRRSSTGPVRPRGGQPREPTDGTDRVHVSEVPGPTNPGMKAVVLNWRLGENDPFSVVNATICQHLRACGKNALLLQTTDVDWPQQLAALAPATVEFAYTWQGLGSTTTVGATSLSLWDFLRIPLICIHGDHPSHTPGNHALDSPYCFHLYANADAARYSNRHFRRFRSASVIDIPQLHREPRLGRRIGDTFVIAKNVNDPIDTEALWREQLDKASFDAYMIAVEILKHRLAQETYVDIHEALDGVIAENGLDWLAPTGSLDAHHQFHSQLDHYLRSHKSVTALAAIREFPVRVYGRGWHRAAREAPASHVFEAGRNMAESQDLYYTRFGLIDISPSKGLHDRTRRAMVNGAPFLSSANLEDSFADIGRFDRLFFDFRPHSLAEKCAAVASDPDAHANLAQAFADTYHNRFHFRDFVNRIDHLAKLCRTTALSQE